MHSALSRLLAQRALVATLTVSVLTACGDPKPPPTPDPPQVTLTVPEPNAAAPTLKIRVIVSGCDAVSQVAINDRETFIKTVPYTSGSMDFEIAANELKYTKGIAADLALNAKATCSDGRTNVSQPAAATFMPVTKLVRDPDPNGQVVTDFFIAEGGGAGVNFIGCGNPTTGIGTLFRVDAKGQLLKSVEMGLPCSPFTVYTDVNPSTDKRWVWTPGVGAIAVKSDFTISGRTKSTYSLANLSVTENGDAIIADENNNVSRLKHTSNNGATEWNFASPWPLVAPPLKKGSDVLVAFVRQPDVSTATVLQIVVARLGFDAAGEIKDPVSERVILNYNGNFSSPPLASFSPDGSILYLGFPFGSNQSRVQACRVDMDGCEGPALKWTSGNLPVPLQFILPYAAGSRVAAIGAQRVWFLNAETGAIANKDGKSVDASGTLRVIQVQLGRATSSEFYLLNGPARDGALPLEIVAVDSAEKGELFRYEISSSLSCSVDNDNRLWMRIGNDLVQALPLSDYRKVLP
ncbi:hypothetical protein D7V97_18640 [Corallococcus sp. CA053C]|uniref:hypothetical protein n=1 Tax=Corallococcus sp. CA053C TaxID=2316732 RepID=UPI000EA20037|nr:hypothetical protein [Corallococcus sp. CA053C]RKH08702.1 hypothetical protein D7V97_18640 [Corallococcus sp. CA053C]